MTYSARCNMRVLALARVSQAVKVCLTVFASVLGGSGVSLWLRQWRGSFAPWLWRQG